jgi:hypothetical protein
MNMKFSAYKALAFLLVFPALAQAQTPPAPAPDGRADPDREDWIVLFNGKDLTGWTPKIAKYEVGDNYGNTFRVENGLLEVRYDKKAYKTFDFRFGHLFYKDPYSYYRLVVEYRFVGEQVPGAPDWAKRNSGAMLHSPDPRTMPRDQDFPISIEAQLLGGLGDGKPRSTANMCSPGTEIVYQGKLFDGHCLNSSSPTFDGEQWVRAGRCSNTSCRNTAAARSTTTTPPPSPTVSSSRAATSRCRASRIRSIFARSNC